MDILYKKSRERVIWISVTVFLLTSLVLLTFSPKILAGNEDSIEQQNAEAQRLLGVFSEVFEYVRKNYVDEEKTDPNSLIEGALKGLFDSLEDPHSAYLTADEMRNIQDTTTGKFGGVGLIITKGETGIQVIAPIEDTPAYRAGVSAGDVIVKINDEDAVEFNIDEVVSRLRGDPGTEVEITFSRGDSYMFSVSILRDLIEVPTVKREMISDEIGYLKISNFTPLTPEKSEEAIQYFDLQNYQSLIIDLRNNPGGLLPSVVEVADFFLFDGPIVSTRSRIASENDIYYATNRKTIVADDVEIIVLVDKGSASASEILAGALQDTGRAIIVGQNTYGKGSVQQIKPVGTGGFRLTMSLYYTPSGNSMDKTGIKPDVIIEGDELTDEQQSQLTEIRDNNSIAEFVKDVPIPTEQEILAFIEDLRETGITLEERHLRKLIKNELNRTNNEPPVFDLEYDLMLQEAVKILTESQVPVTQ